MGLTVEDGTGIPDAESYVTVDFFMAYLLSRGLGLKDGVTELDIEAALRRATDAINALYGDVWAGRQLTGSQGLDFPRTGIVIGGHKVDAAPLPRSLMHATCEAAWREANEPGSLMPDVDSAARVVSETVGPISVSYAAPAPGESSSVPMVYTTLNKLLARLTTSAGGAMGSSVFFLKRA